MRTKLFAYLFAQWQQSNGINNDTPTSVKCTLGGRINRFLCSVVMKGFKFLRIFFS